VRVRCQQHRDDHDGEGRSESARESRHMRRMIRPRRPWNHRNYPILKSCTGDVPFLERITN
jgi:hypothetical protein